MADAAARTREQTTRARDDEMRSRGLCVFFPWSRTLPRRPPLSPGLAPRKANMLHVCASCANVSRRSRSSGRSYIQAYTLALFLFLSDPCLLPLSSCVPITLSLLPLSSPIAMTFSVMSPKGADCPQSPSIQQLITPPPSADILPRDPPVCAAEIATFFLPPAVSSTRRQSLVKDAGINVSTRSSSTSSVSSDSSIRSAPQFTTSKLPPPPMRSRRIIQMQPVLPKPTKTIQKNITATAPKFEPSALVSLTTTQSSDSLAPASAAAAPAPKTRRGHGVSAATRKTARKIAHSAIERRRRSKMNDEFDALKSMVPACRVASQANGETNLHKLGILQATVEYLRYLEECIEQLQARVSSLESGEDVSLVPVVPLPREVSSSSELSEFDEHRNNMDVDEDDEDSEDEDEEDLTDRIAREAVSPHHVLSSAEEDDMEEVGKEVSRTLLMLRQVSDVSIPTVSTVRTEPPNTVRVGLRVCDLLG
ncbi:uncharacterized protein V1518DRAFT_421415 [Limtongia smithiae]|uniref:uncharacterized protein n=1 Tax=Limtongia smithiae TaxID=1125753 RepID=UPI0034CE5B92